MRSIAFALAAFLLAAAPSVVRAQDARADAPELTIPGGAAFVRSIAGLPAGGPLSPDGLPVRLAELLEPESMDPVAERLRQAFDDLAKLRAELHAVPAPGDRPPRLGGPGDAEARALLDVLGLRPDPGADPPRLVAGDEGAHHRELLGHLGLDVEALTDDWAAGDPVRIEIPDLVVRLPSPFPAWRAIFGEPVPAPRALDRFLEDDAARSLILGLGRLDRRSRGALLDELDLADFRDADRARRFAALAPYLNAGGGGLTPPGGDRAAWATILGIEGTGTLTGALVDAPRPVRHLWRALALVPPARARYLLTLYLADAGERTAWARRLAAAVPDSAVVAGLRWPHDVAELFAALRLAEADTGSVGIDWPGGAGAWVAAVRSPRPPVASGTVPDGGNAPAAVSGPAADAEILEALLQGSSPDRPQQSAIAAYLTVARALRYQPDAVATAAVPVLFPAWSRVGHAYGFLATPAPLEPRTAVGFARHLLRVEALEGPAGYAATRQLQATLLLVRRLLQNGFLGDADRDAVLQALFDGSGEAPSADAAGTGADPAVALAGWYRQRLLPAVARALRSRGWDGDPGDHRAVLFAGLVGSVDAPPLQVDGIDYRYNAVVALGDRMTRHLVEQHVPVLDRLLALDAAAAAAVDRPGSPGGDRVRLADGVEELLGAIRSAVPDAAAAGELDVAHPVPVPRSSLFGAGADLVAELRSGAVSPEIVLRVRRGVGAWLGDALVGLAYALHLSSDRQLGEHRHLVWTHRLDAGGRDGDPSGAVGPWRATDVTWDPDEGEVLRNGLLGIADHTGRWRLQDAAIAGGGARLPAAVEAGWGATLGQIHTPSLNEKVQPEVFRIHRAGSDWLIEAARARQPDLPAPASPAPADGPRLRAAETPSLRDALLLLAPPTAVEEIVDAVAAGSERGALRRTTPGIRFSLGLLAAGEPADPQARWRLDQLVGMAADRPGRGLGLEVPRPIRYGEAAPGDPLLYARLLDVRVALALAMEERDLPATLHARLLAEAMAATLGDVRQPGALVWRQLLAAISTAVDAGDVRDWTVALAFSDELEPAAPDAALEARQRRRDAALGGAWRPAGLRLPGSDVEPEAGQTAVFRTRVELATVDVGVWSDGRFVTDLDPEDFTVLVEGLEVTPSFVRLEGNPEATTVAAALPAPVAQRVEPAGRNLVLVADLQATPGPSWRRVLDDALELVRSGLATRDRVAIIEIDSNGRPRLRVGFTRDHRAAASALESLSPAGAGVAAGGMQRALRELPRTLCDNSICTCRDQSLCSTELTPAFSGCVTRCGRWEASKLSSARALSRSFGFEERNRAAAQIDVLRAIADTLRAGDPANRPKTLLLLSPGFEVQPGRGVQQMLAEYESASRDVNPGLGVQPLPTSGSDDLRPELDALVDGLRRCRCTLYTVDTLGLNRRLVDAGARVDVGDAATLVRRSLQDSLTALALDTGGRPFLNSSDFDRAFATVLDESRLRWVLGIPVAELGLEGDESRWREVRVEVARDGVTVRSREGFFWPRREGD